MSVPPLLALFDIDGTLLLDDAGSHGRAMVAALREVFGVDVEDAAVATIDPYGKTDRRIAREVAALAGLEASAFEARRRPWADLTAARFAQAAPASRPSWRVRPGAHVMLEELRAAGVRLGILSGNLQPVARIKLDLMGLGDLFEAGLGAFGDQAEARTDLPALARAGAGGPSAPWPRARTAIVGDTLGDLAAARADGLHCVLLASERFPAALLADADAVAADAEAAGRVVLDWHARG